MKAHTTWFLRESRTAKKAGEALPVMAFVLVLLGSCAAWHFLARAMTPQLVAAVAFGWWPTAQAQQSGHQAAVNGINPSAPRAKGARMGQEQTAK
jgi:hypothetical protein